MLSHLLPVAVNTLLNGLEAMAYGPLLLEAGISAFFPPGAGICMYLMASGVAQVVLSLGSSFAHGVTACPIVEAIPFLHLIGHSIQDKLGEGRDLRTTLMLAHALLALVTSAGFTGLWAMGLERAVHQVPRTVLLGTMAGVGIFLLRSARSFVSPAEVYLAGLAVAAASVAVERRLRPPFFIPIACLVLAACFYGAVSVAGIDLATLRQRGWLPRTAATSIDPWSVYSGLSVRAIDFKAVLAVLPIIAAGTAFNMINVLINVPSLARFTGLAFSTKSELLVHAACNFVTALVGCVPTYMAYTNSILFVKGGAVHRATGVLLGLSTMLLMARFGGLLPFVPTLLTVYLPCNLGLDLVVEAAVVPFKTCRGIDYAVILATMLVVGFRGFTAGLLCGLLLAATVVVVDKRHVEPRNIPAFVTLEAVDRMVVRQALLRRIHTVQCSGQLYFGNLAGVVDGLSFHPTDCIFQIIDFTRMTTCDLNVLEGLCGYLRQRRIPDVVLVNNESLSTIVHLPNYPSRMHAVLHCERLLHSRLGPEQEQQLGDVLQAARSMEQRLWTNCSFEPLHGQPGCRLDIDGAVAFLESGSAQLDDHTFVEPRRWLLSEQAVTCITECSWLLSTDARSVDREAVDFIANLYRKETTLQ